MEASPKIGATGLTESQRSFALNRFHTLRPFLEDGVPLARIAQDNHLHLRTVSRWAENYHQSGLAGLCRQGRTDKNSAGGCHPRSSSSLRGSRYRNRP